MELEDCEGCQDLSKALQNKQKEVDDLKNQIEDLKDCENCKDKEDQIKNLQDQMA